MNSYYKSFFLLWEFHEYCNSIISTLLFLTSNSCTPSTPSQIYEWIEHVPDMCKAQSSILSTGGKSLQILFIYPILCLYDATETIYYHTHTPCHSVSYILILHSWLEKVNTINICWSTFTYTLIFFAVVLLGIEPRALHKLGKYCINIEALGLIPSSTPTWYGTHTSWNSRVWEMVAGRSEVEGQPEL